MPFDICSDGLGRALYRFGSDRETGQQLELFSASIEGSFMADRGHHPAYPGREFRVLDVEFKIHRKLTMMATFTKIIGARTLGFPQGGKHGLESQAHILCC